MTAKATEKQQPRNVSVGSGNVVSQLFFLWVFRFIVIIKKCKDLKELVFALRLTETAEFNDLILEKNWSEEKIKAAKANRYVLFCWTLFKLILFTINEFINK